MNGEGRRLASAIALVFGVLLHLMVGALVAASGLVAPSWAVTLLGMTWLFFGYWGWRMRRRPFVVLVLPFAMAALLWLVVTAGDIWLGWTA